jgi:hypothetical protein
MSIHLSDPELMDVLEGTADPASPRHLAGCLHCGARLEHVREGLRWAPEAEVPEPSPLYWEAFRRQVARRIESAEPSLPWVRPRPLLAVAAALVAVVGLVPTPRPPVAPPAVAVTWTALPALDEDSGLQVFAALSPTSDDLARAGLGCGVQECVAELSGEESRSLEAELRARLHAGEL